MLFGDTGKATVVLLLVWWQSHRQVRRSSVLNPEGIFCLFSVKTLDMRPCGLLCTYPSTLPPTSKQSTTLLLGIHSEHQKFRTSFLIRNPKPLSLFTNSITSKMRAHHVNHKCLLVSSFLPSTFRCWRKLLVEFQFHLVTATIPGMNDDKHVSLTVGYDLKCLVRIHSSNKFRRIT